MAGKTFCNNVQCIWSIDGECTSLVTDFERKDDEPEVLLCLTFQEWQE